MPLNISSGLDWLVYLTTTFVYFALRMTKLGRWRWYDHENEVGLEESQKTEDRIGIHRNETRSTGSAAWRVSLEMRYTNRIHRNETRSTGSAGTLKITWFPIVCHTGNCRLGKVQVRQAWRHLSRGDGLARQRLQLGLKILVSPRPKETVVPISRYILHAWDRPDHPLIVCPF